MNILLLAPHPFYQDRGTPIAVDMILRVMSERGENVDIVTYHEGQGVSYDHIRIHRIVNIPFIRGIRPGFSLKKIICDIFMIIKVVSLVLKNRYDLIHAVEESVFIALFVKKIFKIPYLYDMDSCMSQQMVNKNSIVSHFLNYLEKFEECAVRNAKSVIPVCETLSENIEKYNPEKIVVLQDVSLLEDKWYQDIKKLRVELEIKGILLMYVGNLETYQGIDLLLESFALVLNKTIQADLVIIGGESTDIQRYKEKSKELGIAHRVHFLGPKPIEHLGGYLSQADILISPRLLGENTPMKLYSYLHSGKALLATNLPTHTQVLDNRVAMLADPSPEAFSKGMLYLIEDTNLQYELGQAGKRLIEERYSFEVFRDKLNALYDWLQMEIGQDSTTVGSTP